MSDIFPTNVPASLSKDGWWLSASSDASVSQSTGGTNKTGAFWQDWGRRSAIWIIPLIILADWLFWGHCAGISLAFFALVIVGAAVFLRWREITSKQAAKAVVLSVVSVLPSVVATGFFPFIFLLFGTMGATLMLHDRLTKRFAQNVKTFVLFTFTGPFWIFIDAFSVRKDINVDVPMKRILNSWALPAGLGLIFLSLFVQANPLFEDVVMTLFDFEWLQHIDIARVFFWIGLLMLLWPFLNMTPGVRQAAAIERAVRAAPRWLAQDTIRNALLVFNVMFAAQTALDLTYLWGGVSLPDDMTYAEYAHRGAYPLLATALLAGIFMLCATYFEPLSQGNRKLLYIWIAQNAALVLSSVLRLDLYVTFYSLTYLRIAAFIWMALVAVGLVLIAIRIAQDRSNGWVLKRIAGVATLVLYLCCFVNFASLIADYNVTHSKEISGQASLLIAGIFAHLGRRLIPQQIASTRRPISL